VVLLAPALEGAGRLLDDRSRALGAGRAVGLVAQRHRQGIVDHDRDPVRLARHLAQLDRRLEEQDDRAGRRAGAQPEQRRAPPG
jgi:hypothetical protein